MSRQLQLDFTAGRPDRSERLQRTIDLFQDWTMDLARRLEIDMKFFWIQTVALLPEIGEFHEDLALEMLAALHIDAHALWDALPVCTQALLRAVPYDAQTVAPPRFEPAREPRRPVKSRRS